MKKGKKILVIGASGKFGHLLFIELQKNHQVIGTVRSREDLPFKDSPNLISNIDIYNLSDIENIIKENSPDIVINCVGIIKQLEESKNSKISIEINSLFPHQLAELCGKYSSRLIHFSTDCIFSGDQGNYKENDFADARDTYGLSKYLGEVNYPHSLTLRTSIIGHELFTSLSLLDWFLAQENQCKGFTKAIYSGLTTLEITKVINDYIIPHDDLHGIYHLSGDPISKYDLLEKIKAVYKKDIKIIPSDDLAIDRSMNSDRLRAKTGFKPKNWDVLIQEMHTHFLNSNLYNRR